MYLRSAVQLLRQRPLLSSPCRLGIQNFYSIKHVVRPPQQEQAVIGSIVASPSTSLDPLSLIHRVPSPPIAGHHVWRYAILLFTPSFAPLLQPQSEFLSAIIRKLHNNVVGYCVHEKLKVRALVAVVDRIAGTSPISSPALHVDSQSHEFRLCDDFEGMSYLFGRDEFVGSTFLPGLSPDAGGCTSSVLPPETPSSLQDLKSVSLTITPANTIFSAGKERVCFTANWLLRPGMSPPRLRAHEDVPMASIRVPVSRSGVIGAKDDGTYTFSLNSPLRSLTYPRKIKRSFGNVVRQLSDGSQEMTASHELEFLLPRFMEKAIAAGVAPDQARPDVYAIIVPPSSSILPEKLEPGLLEYGHTALARESEAEGSNALNLMDLLQEGGAIYRVLGGGGQWGNSAGLVTLQPPPVVCEPSLPEAENGMVLEEQISFQLQEFAPPGHFLIYCTRPLPLISRPEEDGTRKAAGARIRIGTIPDRSLAQPQGIDSDSQSPTKDAAVFKNVLGHFGALSCGGIELTMIPAEGNADKAHKIHIDAPLTVAEWTTDSTNMFSAQEQKACSDQSTDKVPMTNETPNSVDSISNTSSGANPSRSERSGPTRRKRKRNRGKRGLEKVIQIGAPDGHNIRWFSASEAIPNPFQPSKPAIKKIRSLKSRIPLTKVISRTFRVAIDGGVPKYEYEYTSRRHIPKSAPIIRFINNSLDPPPDTPKRRALRAWRALESDYASATYWEDTFRRGGSGDMAKPEVLVDSRYHWDNASLAAASKPRENFLRTDDNVELAKFEAPAAKQDGRGKSEAAKPAASSISNHAEKSGLSDLEKLRVTTSSHNLQSTLQTEACDSASTPKQPPASPSSASARTTTGQRRLLQRGLGKLHPGLPSVDWKQRKWDRREEGEERRREREMRAVKRGRKKWVEKSRDELKYQKVLYGEDSRGGIGDL